MSYGRAFVAVSAMICIVTLEAFALSKGIDGAGLAGALALLGGLGGYVAGRRRPSP